MALTYPDPITERIVKALSQMWDHDEYRDNRLFPELVRRLQESNTEPDFDAFKAAQEMVMWQWCYDFSREWTKNDD